MKKKVMSIIVCVVLMVPLFLLPVGNVHASGWGDIWGAFQAIFSLGTASVDVINSIYDSQAYQQNMYAQRNYYDTLTRIANAEYATGRTNSGATNSYSIFNDNKTINYTTNNQYVSKTYNEITYSPEYNSYYTFIENNHYFITYAPTYTNITYIGETATWDERESIDLFFQLPDGRNSYYLTVDDIRGIVFNYDVSNYELVAEDDGTLGLYHFDGNIYDSSYYSGTAEWQKGASTTYMDAGAFDGALYLNNQAHTIQFNLPKAIGQGDYTLEYRLYLVPDTNIQMVYSNIVMPLILHNHTNGVNTQYVYESFATYNPPYEVPDQYSSCYMNYRYSSQTDGIVGTQNIDYVYLCGDLVSSSREQNLIYDDTVVAAHTTQNVIDLYSIPMFGMYSDEMSLMSYSYHAEVKPQLLVSGEEYKKVPSEILPVYCSYYGRDLQFLYDDHHAPVVREQVLNNLDIGISTNSSDPHDTYNTIAVGEWVTYAVSRRGGATSVYINGMRTDQYVDDMYIGDSITLDIPAGHLQYAYLDELRITDKALYIGSNYSPSSAPFDTNRVLALPNSSDCDEDAVKIQSNVIVNNSRIGGVRPTYPVTGNVFVALDNDLKVIDIQIYDGADWKQVNGAIKSNDEWLNLMGYSFADDVFVPPDDSGGDDPGGGTNPGGGDNGGSSGNGWRDIWDTVSSFFSGIGELIGNLLTSLFDFINKGIEAVTNLTEYGSTFGQFLAAAIPFIPSELMTVIVAGIVIAIVIRIIKLIINR